MVEKSENSCHSRNPGRRLWHGNNFKKIAVLDLYRASRESAEREIGQICRGKSRITREEQTFKVKPAGLRLPRSRMSPAKFSRYDGR